MSVDANIQQQLQAVYNRHPDFLLVATASSSSEKEYYHAHKNTIRNHTISQTNP